MLNYSKHKILLRLLRELGNILFLKNSLKKKSIFENLAIGIYLISDPVLLKTLVGNQITGS
ncbi:hypothetical protein HX13_01695 [Chryseobacterium sp. P1-3]|nr:hypothetical protein HX13_01695 [Chryseobacterium sp. P1-3]